MAYEKFSVSLHNVWSVYYTITQVHNVEVYIGKLYVTLQQENPLIPEWGCPCPLTVQKHATRLIWETSHYNARIIIL